MANFAKKCSLITSVCNLILFTSIAFETIGDKLICPFVFTVRISRLFTVYRGVYKTGVQSCYVYITITLSSSLTLCHL